MKKILLHLLVVVIVISYGSGIVFSQEKDSSAIVAQAEYLRPMEALIILKSQVESLTAEDFKNIKTADSKKNSILIMIEQISLRVEKGELKSLESIVDIAIRSMCEAWIKADKQAELIESINNTVLSLSNANKSAVPTIDDNEVPEEEGNSE
ncbi:MAG: hypothetical protein GX660_17080 [Clostridiaceae bacterium]|nr:hypothetical protein [Clostridiaceae bacterium]